MNGTFRLKDIEAMEATMSLTMTVAEWRALQQQIGSDKGWWRIHNLISKMVAQAEKTVWATAAEDES